MVELLLNAGAKIEAEDMVSAVKRWYVLRLVSLLQNKNTPLHWAAMSGSRAGTVLLLSAGSNPNAEDMVTVKVILLAEHRV